MKILLATHFFPPSSTGGTETRTLGYALELKQLGYDVQVVCAGNWDQGDQYWNGYRDEVYRGIRVRRIDLNWTLAEDPNRYLYDNPIIERHFTAWLEEWLPDIVHITSCLTLSASILRAIKRKNIPVVLTLTDYWFICPQINLVKGDGTLCDGRTSAWDCLQCKLWDSRLYHSLNALLPETWTRGILLELSQRPAFNRQRGLRGLALNMAERKRVLAELIGLADILTAPSAYLAKIFASSGVTRQIQIIHSGHDLSWLTQMPVKTLADRIRFGYIGQLIPIKGTHILISAFMSHNISNNASLQIYGDLDKDPAYSAQLRALASHKNTRIKFMGAIPHARLGEALSKIDILIVPSIWHENNPRIIQEAFASRTPVIAANVGGIAEFVDHEVNGLLYERLDEAGLAAQMERLVANPSLIERLRAGITTVKTMQAEVLEFQHLYAHLVKSENIRLPLI